MQAQSKWYCMHLADMSIVRLTSLLSTNDGYLWKIVRRDYKRGKVWVVELYDD